MKRLTPLALLLLLTACPGSIPKQDSVQVTKEFRCLADTAGKVVIVTTRADTKANLLAAGVAVTETVLTDPDCVDMMNLLVPAK